MNHVGKRYKTKENGDLIITRYVSFREVHIIFVDTGYETITQMGNITNGIVKDRLMPSVCGVGVLGDEATKVNGKSLKEYDLWNAMLQRCYGDVRQGKQPTYIGCSVSDNFKYYPYFKKWCSVQIGFNLDGFALDKDLLSKGNKIYSEDTCVFIPQEINNLITKNEKSRGEFLIGVTYHKYARRFASNISVDGKAKHLGCFETEIEAFQAYRQAKEDQIKVVANRWKEQIDARAYEALMSYQVEPQINSKSISLTTALADHDRTDYVTDIRNHISPTTVVIER
ncbi:hypothetical protein [Acinetobacter schindleri]|uniref:hypothetical protein n=1 Tax=Acinetobacter schindleri TaxID=108981 RepID=UPI0030FD1453